MHPKREQGYLQSTESSRSRSPEKKFLPQSLGKHCQVLNQTADYLVMLFRCYRGVLESG